MGKKCNALLRRFRKVYLYANVMYSCGFVIFKFDAFYFLHSQGTLGTDCLIRTTSRVLLDRVDESLRLFSELALTSVLADPITCGQL